MNVYMSVEPLDCDRVSVSSSDEAFLGPTVSALISFSLSANFEDRRTTFGLWFLCEKIENVYQDTP